MIDLSDIPAILRRHIPWLVVVPAIFAVLALAYTVLKTPVYTTSSEVFVQSEAVQIIPDAPLSFTQNQTVQGMDLDSQIFVFLSAAVLNEVANNLGLDDDPDFNRPGLRDKLLGRSSNTSRSSAEIRAGTIESLREAIQVFRLDRSFVFSIRVRHSNPVLAAAIANETVAAYINQSRASRSESLSQASAALNKQADDLRARVEDAEAKVEQYKAQQGLISTAGGTVVDQQIEALNTQITSARVELERTKSLNDQFASLTLSDIEAGAVPQGTSENNVLNSLRVQYATIAGQVAEAQTTLGSNHPTLRELNSQLNNTQRAIQTELQRAKSAAQSQFEQARATLAALETQSKFLQSQNSAQGKALIELRQLQSEADASRAIYEAFLKRARELAELPKLDSDQTRVLSLAQVPRTPSGPRKILVLGAAIMFGFVLAAGTIVVLTLLTGSILSERQLVTETGVPILANQSARQENARFAGMLPSWLTGRGGKDDNLRALAPTRVAYALQQSVGETRPANVLFLSLRAREQQAVLARGVAEELHDMGEETLFAYTFDRPFEAETGLSSVGKRNNAPNADAKYDKLHQLAQKAGEKTDQHATTAAQNSTRKRNLTNFLQVEQVDARRKYASGGDLGSANNGFLLVDAGNIFESPLLPVLLRHCDRIVLVTALNETTQSDLKRAFAYLEPWQDRILGHVVA